ncbi:MAG: hypothetical protein BGO21_05400 [Dyadobacter sp. 50-39]|uniref:sensor histidine kinase n=1 Tax=Dyadobacter sp. 50-39 TaxID=1895756 RepID=UPI00095E2B33|nr:HAMP domain-containing sensor histidine kinase [Dyadobacter sp. 50-39]OJV22591.1 MAG: hypothetical protein BGO21_05400 [Dyadobacter sp. 50-39]
MKLLQKTTRDYLIASISILIITGAALFAMLRYEVGAEMNEQLELLADELFEQIRAGNFNSAPMSVIGKASPDQPEGNVFSDSMVYDRIQKETEEYHVLKQTRQLDLGRYQVTVMTSHIGWDRYYLSIFFIFSLEALLLTGSGIIINYYINKNVLRPFLGNLRKVQQFSVSSTEPLQLNESSITEFIELNRTLKEMTDRSRKEYLALREFTENASHEIQTPLSIIQSKLDRMSQLEISEQMAGYIVQAKSGVDRLSKMNRSLLLLAKLDNKAFTGQHPVELQETIQQQLSNMEELFESRQIKLTSACSAATVRADPYLVETLISNLLSNALRYTTPGGRVDIGLADRTLTVSNSGPELQFAPERIFERFTKNDSNSRSTGLGLAIVREICLFYNWPVRYAYAGGIHPGGIHRFEIEFKQ